MLCSVDARLNRGEKCLFGCDCFTCANLLGRIQRVWESNDRITLAQTRVEDDDLLGVVGYQIAKLASA